MNDELRARGHALLDLVRDVPSPTPLQRARVRERVTLTVAAGVAGSLAAAAAQGSTTAAGSAMPVAGSKVVAMLGASAEAGSAASGALLTGVVPSVAGVGKTFLGVGLGKLVGVASLVAVAAGGTTSLVASRRPPEPQTLHSVAPPAVVPNKLSKPKPAELAPPSTPSAPVTAEPSRSPEADSVSASPAPLAPRALRKMRQSSARVDAAGESRPAAVRDSAGLREEIQLIGQASSALQRGEEARAARLLAEHAARFPTGSLAQEREGLRLLARCQQKDASAREAAARVLAASPNGLLGIRIRKACGL